MARPDGAQPQQGGASRAEVAAAVDALREDQRLRVRRRVGMLLFVGVLISLLVHIDIIFLLNLLRREGGGAIGPPPAMEIEFAVIESESLTDLPEGFEEDSVQSEATELEATLDEASESTLDAPSSSAPLSALNQAAAPSLGGGGSGSAGAGFGGSGGSGGASFFGIKSTGSRFCYIVDRSGSMGNGGKLEAAVAEVAKSLQQLPDFTRFFLLFFSSGQPSYLEPIGQNGWNTARRRTISRLLDEVATIHASGGTFPFDSFQRSFELDPPPDVIFFLTDGKLQGFNLPRFQELLPTDQRVVVNTIAFGDNSSQQLLQDMASITGGEYRFVRTGSQP